MREVVLASQWFFLGYFVLMCLAYLTLDIIAFWVLRRYMDKQSLSDLPVAFSDLEPPVSILVPAYNESMIIAAAIRSLLQLHYSEYEIVVINDGSTDDTLAVLTREFGLVPCSGAWRNQVQSKPVKGVYQSTVHPNLRVVDKENGRKADSMNAGINYSLYPLFCAVDADSILQRDSLRRVVQPFLDDARTVATGGTIRIANGCKVQGGFLTEVGLPNKFLPLMQIIEYLRAFLFGRLGWEPFNAVLIISGAFGLFRRDLVTEIGGYRTDTVGEDMELVMRMHRHLGTRGQPYRLHYVPDPVCWTEAPEDLKTLRSQRTRWQRGLSESLLWNRELLFNRHGGGAGWFAFPFFLLFEWCGPLVEFAGLVFMVVAAFAGAVSPLAAFAFLFVAVVWGILLSVTALLLEELSFHVYLKPRDLVVLLAVAIAENFGYRQINTWWRLKGLWMWATKTKTGWEPMVRTGSWQQ